MKNCVSVYKIVGYKTMKLPSGMTSRVPIALTSRDHDWLFFNFRRTVLGVPFEFDNDSPISIKVALFILVVMASLSLFEVLWDCLSWCRVYNWDSFVLGKSLYTEAHPMVNNNETSLPIANDSSGPIVNSGSKSLIQFVIIMTCNNLVLLAAAV